MANTNSQIQTAMTGGAIIGGIIYGKSRNLPFFSTFGIAVVFGLTGYLLSAIIEENVR